MNKRSIYTLSGMHKRKSYQTERDPLSFPSLKMPEQDDIDAKDLSFVLVPHKDEPQTRDEKFKDDIIKEKLHKQWRDEQLTYNEIYRSRGPYYQPPSQGQRQNQLFPQGLRGDKKMKKSYKELKASLMKSFNQLKPTRRVGRVVEQVPRPEDIGYVRLASKSVAQTEFELACPNCQTVFKFAGSEPFMTECPNCGEEVNSQHSINKTSDVEASKKLAKGEGVMEDVGVGKPKKKMPKKEEPAKEEKKEEPEAKPEEMDIDLNVPPTPDEMVKMMETVMTMAKAYEEAYAVLRPLQKKVEAMRKNEINPMHKRFLVRLEQYLQSINEKLKDGKSWTGWIMGHKYQIEISRRNNPAYAELFNTAYEMLTNEGKQRLDEMKKQLTTVSETVTVTKLTSKIKKGNWIDTLKNVVFGWLNHIVNGFDHVNQIGSNVVDLLQRGILEVDAEASKVADRLYGPTSTAEMEFIAKKIRRVAAQFDELLQRMRTQDAQSVNLFISLMRDTLEESAYQLDILSRQYHHMLKGYGSKKAVIQAEGALGNTDNPDEFKKTLFVHPDGRVIDCGGHYTDFLDPDAEDYEKNVMYVAEKTHLPADVIKDYIEEWDMVAMQQGLAKVSIGNNVIAIEMKDRTYSIPVDNEDVELVWKILDENGYVKDAETVFVRINGEETETTVDEINLFGIERCIWPLIDEEDVEKRRAEPEHGVFNI